MKERPILFSAPMVRALLDGSKTQTRRVVRRQFPLDAVIAEVSATTVEGWQTSGHSGLWWDDAGACFDDAVRCPFGIPGDRLWVRETWGYFDPDCSGQDFEDKNDDGVRGGPCRTYHNDMMKEGSPLREFWRRRVTYAATWKEPKFGNGPDRPDRWRPSIHMPRWASRITLEVTSVRVERLQDISEADAKAEGCEKREDPNGEAYYDTRSYWQGYRHLWESINGPGSWDANPWVWVVEFRRLT